MKLVDFGSIMSMEKGKKPAKQFKKCENGLLPYVDIKAFETGVIDNYTNGDKCLPCNEGDVLIVCDGSRSGLVGRAIDGYVGSTLAKITAEGLTPNYLFHFLQGKYALLNTRKKGTGTPHLNPELLKRQKIYVPNFAEQQRIVAHIEELFSQLDKGVETLQTIKQQLAVYRQAVLKEAFEEVDGETTIIRNLCKDIKVGIVIKPTQYYVNSGGIYAFRNSNVRRGFIDDREWAMISIDGHISNKRSEVHTGDVLISRSGANLGMASAIPEKYDGYNAIDVVIAVPDKDKIIPAYLAHYTNSPFGQVIVKERERGAAQAHLNVTVYGKLPIVCPSIETQRTIIKQIEERCSICDSIEQTVDAALAQAEALRQSILKKAFEGGFTQ